MPTFCSHNSRDTSLESPIGSASAFTRAFLFEVPLPWSRIPLETPQLPEQLRTAIANFEAAKGKTSVYLLAPDSTYAVDGARLIDIAIENGTVHKHEYIAADGNIAKVIDALAADQPLPSSVTEDTTPWRDVAICTHGSRDACCATFGAPTYLKMHAAAKHLPNTRVWRCSHLGGHRFAPTLNDLPDGRVWGLLDEDTARNVLLGGVEPAKLIPHYRGFVGQKGPELQMLEAHILETIGWRWIEFAQTGEVLARDEQGRGTHVRITGTHPDGDSLCFEGDISWGEEFTTIASCNAEPVTYVRKHLENTRELVPNI